MKVLGLLLTGMFFGFKDRRFVQYPRDTFEKSIHGVIVMFLIMWYNEAISICGLWIDLLFAVDKKPKENKIYDDKGA